MHIHIRKFNPSITKIEPKLQTGTPNPNNTAISNNPFNTNRFSEIQLLTQILFIVNLETLPEILPNHVASSIRDLIPDLGEPIDVFLKPYMNTPHSRRRDRFQTPRG